MQILVFPENYLVDKLVENVEKFPLSTPSTQFSTLFAPIFSVLILPLCDHKHLINRVTETAFRHHNFSVFGEKVRIQKALGGAKKAFTIFIQKTL